VARANLRAARASLAPMTTLDSRAFNIGTAVETDVLELAQILRAVSGAGVAIRHAPARPGEQLRSAVRVDKAAELLGWRPEQPLARGLALTFEWFAAQRQGVVG
jgi:UDP-glucose 4-epimerase